MKLYPRLARTFAEDEFTKQASLSPEELAGVAATTHPLQVWPATGAPRVTPDELGEIRSHLVQTAGEHGWPSPLARGEQHHLDLTIARNLWEHTQLSGAEASFGDVWSFLALVVAPDVVWWRAAGSTNVERFVASDLTRHTLARLWWRAHLFTWGLDDPEEGWELWRSSTIGEADLDQIQTRRGGYGRSPKVFRTLVRAFPVVARRAEESGVDRRVFWRQAYLRWVLRIGAFTDLSGLSEAELDHDLTRVALQIEPAVEATDIAERADVDEDADAIDGVRDFDTIPLRTIVVHLAEAVRAKGEASDSDLCALFESVTGIAVPSSRRDIVRGIAWQGVPLHYLVESTHEGIRLWRVGDVLPAPDRRWGAWTVQSFKQHVADSNGQPDVDKLAAELFAGHAGRTVRRLVRLAVKEARPPAG